MKSTLKNPKYVLKSNGKAVHKMSIEFYVTEDEITKAIKDVLDYKNISEITHSDVQKQIVNNFYNFGRYVGDDRWEDSMYITEGDAKRYGIRLAKDENGYQMQDVNNKKAVAKIKALGKRLFPAYYTKQKTKKNG